VTVPLDPARLLQKLQAAGVQYVLIGGLAVNAHGVIRSTKDVDICPAPDRENLARLARLLAEIGVRQLGVSEHGFDPRELPFDPTRVDNLTEGGNFRLETPLGVLDIMQWVPGIEAESTYPTLARDAQTAVAFGIDIRVCSLDALLVMKRAAGRPQDLQDVNDLVTAHPEQP
jgi:predicted nucleotidyltransferase